MRKPWIYRIGLSQKEVTEENLLKSGLKYELVEIEIALRLHIPETLDKPYKFHTKMREDAPDFFSCSSLVSYLYMFAGVWMPSLVIDKFFFAEPVAKEDLQYGDLVFSYNEDMSGNYPLRQTSVDYKPGELTTEKKVNHVGMYLGEGKILQAAGNWYKGKVLIEELDETPSFKNIVGFGRVADIKEKRFVVEIPADRPDLCQKGNLINEINRIQ